MKFIFLFLGKTREGYLAEGIADYADRLKRYVDVEIVTLKERYAKNSSDAVIRESGTRQLLDRCGGDCLKVVLDLAGRQPDSPELAAQLVRWRDSGVRRVCFLIGGHLGLDRRAVQEADYLWSLSRLTFTHEMTRLLILEQLYRACTINAGGKYHK